jgi:hypothetical protein
LGEEEGMVGEVEDGMSELGVMEMVECVLGERGGDFLSGSFPDQIARGLEGGDEGLDGHWESGLELSEEPEGQVGLVVGSEEDGGAPEPVIGMLFASVSRLGARSDQLSVEVGEEELGGLAGSVGSQEAPDPME